MKRFWYWSVFAVVLSLAIGVGELHAQPVPGLGPSGTSPAYSPYLNLLRNSTTGSLNYFSLVRPQIQTNQALMGLTNDLNQRQAEDQFGGGLQSTGHPTQFLNLGGYFLNNGGGGKGIGGGGASGGAMRQSGIMGGQGGATPQGGAGGGGLPRY